MFCGNTGGTALARCAHVCQIPATKILIHASPLVDERHGLTAATGLAVNVIVIGLVAHALARVVGRLKHAANAIDKPPGF